MATILSIFSSSGRTNGCTNPDISIFAICRFISHVDVYVPRGECEVSCKKGLPITKLKKSYW